MATYTDHEVTFKITKAFSTRHTNLQPAVTSEIRDVYQMFPELRQTYQVPRHPSWKRRRLSTNLMCRFQQLSGILEWIRGSDNRPFSLRTEIRRMVEAGIRRSIPRVGRLYPSSMVFYVFSLHH